MKDVFMFLYVLCSLLRKSSQLRNVEEKTNIWKRRNSYQRCTNEHGILEGALIIHGDVIEQIDIDWHYVRGLEALDSCNYYCFEPKKFVVKFGVSHRRWNLDKFRCVTKGGITYPNYGISISLQCFYSQRTEKLYNCKAHNFVMTEMNLSKVKTKEITKNHGNCMFHSWPDSKGKFWYNYRTIAGLTCYINTEFFKGRFKTMRWTFNGLEIIHPKRVKVPNLTVDMSGKNKVDIDTFLEDLATRFSNHPNRSYEMVPQTI